MCEKNVLTANQADEIIDKFSSLDDIGRNELLKPVLSNWSSTVMLLKRVAVFCKETAAQGDKQDVIILSTLQKEAEGLIACLADGKISESDKKEIRKLLSEINQAMLEISERKERRDDKNRHSIEVAAKTMLLGTLLTTLIVGVVAVIDKDK